MAQLPQVELKPIKRSHHSPSYTWRTTAAQGFVYPAGVWFINPGENIQTKVDSLVKTQPLLSPLMGSFLVQYDYFFCPIRHYVPYLRDNRVGFDYVEKGFSLPLPTFTVKNDTGGTLGPTADVSWVQTQGVAPGSLYDYLGIPPKFVDLYRDGKGLQVEALTFLSLLDIYRNYMVNPQEEYFYYGSELGGPAFSAYSYGYATMSLKALNDDFDQLVSKGAGTDISNRSEYPSFSKFLSFANSRIVNGGLPVRCYKPDYLVNFLSNSKYELINTATKISTASDSFTINQFRMGNKLQKLSELSIISGNRYGDFIRATSRVNTDDTLDIPEYLGSTFFDMSFTDVNSTVPTTAKSTSGSVQASGSGTPLGAWGGKGSSFNEGRNHYVGASEYGILMCTMSIIPRPDYWRGMSKFRTKTNFSDLFNPALNNLGFQGIAESEYDCLPAQTDSNGPLSSVPTWIRGSAADPYQGGDPFARQVGVQPAWLEYMTRVNRIHGYFTTTQDYWALARNFKAWDTNGQPITSPTAYILNDQLTSPFAATSADSHNFFVQARFTCNIKSPISKRLMPNLQ